MRSESLDQGVRRRRRPLLGTIDHIDEAVAAPPVGIRRRDPRQIGGHPALFPGSDACRPAIQFARRIARCKRGLAALQPDIDKIRANIGNLRKFGRVGVADGNVVMAQQVDEGLRAETLVPDFDDMPQAQTFLLPRQAFQKAGEICGIEFFGRRELPKNRSELLPKGEQAAIQECLYRGVRVSKQLAVRGHAMRLHREDEVLRHFRGPAAEYFGCLRAIERAVDFDRGELAAGEGEFLGVRQAAWIEIIAPGREGPAADADSEAC